MVVAKSADDICKEHGIKFNEKKYFAFGMDAERQAVLVICESFDDSFWEKERLKHSDCVTVNHTRMPVSASNMIHRARSMYPTIIVRKFSPFFT